MKIIKLTTPWRHDFLKSQLNPQIVDYKFEIDNDCRECDYWIVWGDIPHEHERMVVKCPPSNVIYMTDEAHEQKQFNQKFLDQFNYVITCREDLHHRNLIQTHEINHWQLSKSFTDVYSTAKIEKTKSLSVVCSDLTILIGHKKRFAFVNKLIGHFKDRIDVYGRGFNPIDDKWDALAPYKYSVAIENSAIPGYFTEKITECYLAHTLPIYYGPPDITSYFAPESLVRIDVDDYRSGILTIEKLLEEDPWEQLQDTLIEQKLLYLNKYQLFPALCNVVSKLDGPQGEKKRCVINGHETYYSNYRLRKLYQQLKQKLNK
ncbi:glycosyltransferase family 10 domain-containing protein [Mucilaginibacter sp. OK098]|uniref:glycosyltransferase family 10 domain-containing protein n=1 Tax=Mucilaginibacter sp. OK098 TaxID=1855297 RepID=UPI00091DE60F|nr:glycosyltransferase family 10 [Mucilaginibacter sp. OK098]SHN24067.1 Glycosyltransferase family 10 (fucosyltransferase) C-term [Mucilaginibacter sp. OK098]